MLNFTIQQLKTVLCICEEGTMTRAGEKMFLSQSAVSQQVKEIEMNLGLKLFERVGKRLVTTEAGRDFTSSAKEILKISNNLEAKISFLKNGRGTIRVSTECYTCYHWLPGLLKKFKMNSEETEIKIVAEATRRPIEFLKDGKIDIAITSHKPADHSFYHKPLFNDEMVVLVSQNHRFNKLKRPVNSKDFSDQTLFMYNVDDKDSDILNNIFNKNKPLQVQKIELTEAIVEMINADMGVSILPGWLAKPYLKTLQVKILNLSSAHRKRTWYAVYLSRENKMISNFINYLKAEIEVY